MNFPNALPPAKPSAYGSCDRYQYYFGRKDKDKVKSGQTWDQFHAWGQQGILMKELEGSEVMTLRPPLKYRALSPCRPLMAPNKLLKDYQDLSLNVVRMRRDALSIKEGITQRIATARNPRQYYRSELKTLRAAAADELDKLKASSERQLGQGQPELGQVDVVSTRKKQSSKRSKTGRVTFSLDVTRLGTKTKDNATAENLNNSSEKLLELANKLVVGMHKNAMLFSEDLVIPMIPSLYLGGALSLHGLDSSSAQLAHVGGSRMTDVYIKTATHNRSTVQVEMKQILPFCESALQVAFALNSSPPSLLVRGPSKLCFFKETEAGLSLIDTVTRAGISHSSLNPYFSEAVFADRDGSVHLWTADSHPIVVLETWKTRFDVEHDTRSVHYGSHPRQLVLTDPTACCLYDLRTRKDMLELFEVPSNRLLHQEERLVTSCRVTDFAHHILAQHTLMTIDERFVKYPLLYQVIPCLAPPMLLSDSMIAPSQRLAMVGCPTNLDVFAFLADTERSWSTSPIWKLSQMNDFLMIKETTPKFKHKSIIQQRLQTGLIGLAPFSFYEGSFTVLHLTGKGDLFEQTYQLGEGSEDVTKACGSHFDDFPLDELFIEQCASWCDTVEADYKIQIDSNVYASPLTVPKDEITPHQSCSVCSGVNQNPSSPEDRCLQCGLLLADGKAFVDALEQHRMCQMPHSQGEPAFLNQFVPEQFSQDANSKLLMQLWNEQDIKDSLKARDEEWHRRGLAYIARCQPVEEGGQDIDGLSAIQSSISSASRLSRRHRAPSRSGSQKSSLKGAGSDIASVVSELPQQPQLWSQENQSQSQSLSKKKKQKAPKGF